VFITKDAQMPSFTAHYCSDSKTPPAVQWTFTIEPTAGKPDHCTKTISYGEGTRWEIKPRSVQGGDATLSWKADEQSGSLKFKILGEQPEKDDVLALIRKSTTLWYAVPIAETESEVRQFKDGYPLHFDHNGYGIFQLTDFPAPTCSETWNWKVNVARGVAKLNESHTYAVDWMRSQRQEAVNMGYSDVVPSIKEKDCFFQNAGPQSFEDAVAIKFYNNASTNNKKCYESDECKAYEHCTDKCNKRDDECKSICGQIPEGNGCLVRLAKCGNFCAWRDQKWQFNEIGVWGKNYVAAVCSHVQKNGG